MEGKTKCGYEVKSIDRMGFACYYPCEKPVKHKVFYKDIFNKNHTELLCGVHKNSIEKWSLRVKKRLNFNSGLIIEPINLTPPEGTDKK